MYPGNTDAVGGRMIVKAEGGGAPEKLHRKNWLKNALRKIFAHLKDSIFMSMWIAAKTELGIISRPNDPGPSDVNQY